jgi:hypothetical protein
MVIDMNEEKLRTVAQLRAFLNGSLEVRFEPLGEDAQRYAFVAKVVRRLGYDRLKRAGKGVVMRYLEHTTGYSGQQLTRLATVSPRDRSARAGRRYCPCSVAPAGCGE